jgi:hypothetical protein
MMGMTAEHFRHVAQPLPATMRMVVVGDVAVVVPVIAVRCGMV